MIWYDARSLCGRKQHDDCSIAKSQQFLIFCESKPLDVVFVNRLNDHPGLHCKAVRFTYVHPAKTAETMPSRVMPVQSIDLALRLM